MVPRVRVRNPSTPHWVKAHMRHRHASGVLFVLFSTRWICALKPRTARCATATYFVTCYPASPTRCRCLQIRRGCRCCANERLSPRHPRVLHRAEHVDPQRRSSVFMGSHRLLSQQLAQLAFCLQVGQHCSEALSEECGLKVRVVVRRDVWSANFACAILWL